MITAFQRNAFQDDAFQISDPDDVDGGWRPFRFERRIIHKNALPILTRFRT